LKLIKTQDVPPSQNYTCRRKKKLYESAVHSKVNMK